MRLINKILIILYFLFISSCSNSEGSINESEVFFHNADASESKYNIFIGYGQSNMVGATQSTRETSLSDVKVVSICDDASSYLFSSCFSYSNSLNPSDIYGLGRHSLWPSFFDNVMTKNNPNDSILINAAVGGAYLQSLIPCSHADCNKYDNLVRITNMVINDIGYENIESINVFFLQGESEARLISLRDENLYKNSFLEYFENLELLINSLVSSFSDFRFNFFLIRLGSASSDIFNTRFDTLLNDLGYWQVKFCELHSKCTPISILPRSFDPKSNLLSSDGIHYSEKGYDELGSDIAINYSTFKSLGVIFGSEDWHSKHPYILVYLSEYDK